MVFGEGSGFDCLVDPGYNNIRGVKFKLWWAYEVMGQDKKKSRLVVCCVWFVFVFGLNNKGYVWFVL